MFVALVNPKSGGNVGSQLLERFKEIIDEDRVYNLAEVSPQKALEEHGERENLRIIGKSFSYPRVTLIDNCLTACGGDGTVGWILSTMDSMSFPQGAPPIAIVPLGTGNDLSRSLNWGGKYRDKPLSKVLLDIDKADVVHMDRWVLKVTPNETCSTTPDPSEPMTHGDDKLVSPSR